jgi:hypothetical protein
MANASGTMDGTAEQPLADSPDPSSAAKRPPKAKR